MRVSVNLATKPFANLGPTLHRLRIAMGSLAVVILGLWLGLHLLHGRADKVRAQERTLDVDINRYNQEQQGYRVLAGQPQNAAIIDQAGALNALIAKKSFSWTLAMEDLETVLPGGVQVTTLEPIADKKDGHVAVHMRVVGPRNSVVALVANLEHSRRFLQPQIIGESAEATTSANPNQQMEPVSVSNRENFDLLADYNPATTAEQKAEGRKLRAGERAEEADQNLREPHRAAPASAMRPKPPVRRQPEIGTPHSIPPNPLPESPQ